MKSIIIVFPNKSTAIQLRNFLENDGLYVSHICATGASALGIAADMRQGVIVTNSRLSDMTASAMAERVNAGFDIVALSSNGQENYLGNLISLPLPLDKQEFLSTVEMLVATDSSYTNRNSDESEIISNAKSILMRERNINELQAHKFLQKESMQSGKKIVEIAEDIIKNNPNRS